jgi:hypothetical protein
MSDATANENETTEPERGYVVDPNYTPRPTDRVGSFRNDTVGQNHGIKGLAGVFGRADRLSVLTAQKALDPNDRSVSENHVNVYPADTLGDHDREGARERIGAKFEAIKDVVTDEDHRIVSEVRGFFHKGEDGEAGVETNAPLSDQGISTGPVEGPGVTDTVNTESQAPVATPGVDTPGLAGGPTDSAAASAGPVGEAPTETAPAPAGVPGGPDPMDPSNLGQSGGTVSASEDPGALGEDPTV